MKLYLVLFSLVSTMISAQNIPSISVTGEGVVYATPDVVNISLSIENEGNDIAYLKQKNGEKVAKVIQVLSETLPMENFQTSHVSLRKHYDYNTKSHKYYISQGIKIKLEDVSKYESLMEAIFGAGVNQIDYVSFDVKNREKLLREAQLQAINNAREKALFYAVSLEQNIGKALFVNELSSNFGSPQNFKLAAVAESSADAPTETLALGTVRIEAKINVTFALLKEKE
ncbi:MAG: SIMPL domain-containing protein [Capnocytophaga sp.]|nr:SIMPL domain-containing protein [Capnocytophaga sp.]